MKLLPLYLLFFFILLTHAQRRTTAKPTTEAESPKPASRGRGRSRFVSSPEYTKLTESSTESTSRKPIVSRRRPIENVEQKIQPRASLVTSSPRPLTVDRRVTSIGETADRIFLKDNVDRKQTPKLLNSVTTAPLAERTQIIERKPFRTLNKRPKKTYEVEEVIKDDVDSFRRPKKQPRVLTEMNFRATNFPKNEEFSKLSKNLVTPEPSSTSNNIQGNTNLVEEQPQDTTIKPELETSLDSLTEGEPKEEISKSVSVSSTSKPTEAPRVQSSNRRNGLRRVVSRVADPSPPTPTVPRGRSRSRPTQAPDYYFQAVSTSVPSSSFRRRVDSLFSSIEPRNGPSVFNADSTASESRARTGRKIELPPEKISLDIPSRSRRLSTTPKSIKSTSIPTFRSRDGRFRSQRMPVIDEQKLEVLPLFEEEPKLVSTRASRINDNFDSRKKGSDNANNKSRGRVTFREKPAKKEDTDSKSRRRGFHVDNIETSATETDMKVTKFTEASPRLSVSVNADTRTESVKPASSNHKTEIKESVTSEINEVTSRRKVSRKKVIVENKQKDVPVFRGNKKSEVKVVKKHSSEEIGESDNYPEEFKALIKANKGQKESRASAPPSSTLSTAIVTSSTPSTIVYQLTTREINNNDNELKPKPSTPSAIVSSPRWNRSRSLPSTTTQTTPVASSDKRQLFKSTSPTTPASKRTRYRHPTSLYLNSEAMKIKLENNASFKQRVSNKENEVKRLSRGRGTRPPPNSSLFSTKVPKYSTTAKKVDRGKYRSGSTTNVPKYIPTIPSVLYVPTVPFVTAPKSTANTWSGNPTLVEISSSPKDDELGLQVISIDEPVHAIPSENLVNGDFNSFNANSVSVPLPLVNGITTEKPVSIIERIINSITAISTTSPATSTLNKDTVPSTESPSAILKLAPKKSRQTDKTDETRQLTKQIGAITLTTENPTTIIEKILSSLNAIQATDNSGSSQVGTDFNTLSSFTTTPLPSVTKSSTRSLLAHSSTSAIPLSILDEIAPEEVWQKQTIGRLLDILNGLVVTPQASENLVVVTPKSVNKSPIVYSSALSSTISPETSLFSTASTFTDPISINQIITDSSTEIPSSELPSYSEIAISTFEIPSTTSKAASSSEVTSFSEASSSDLTSMASTSEFPSTSSAISTTDVSKTIIPNEEQTLRSTLNSDENLITSSTTTELQVTESSTVETPTTSSPFPSTSEVGIPTTDGINFFTLFSTRPSLKKFEVSPGSVSVFSANDLSNSITLDDNISTTTTTVNIASRSNFDNTATTQSTTTEAESTTLEITTEASVSSSSGTMASSTPVSVNRTQPNSRSGKLLNVDQDPVQNSIDTSTPDYFIFAVLNNNTVLRKKPVSQARAPFFIIGVYPNNTVVKKYPNGTVVPMESIIRVRGFDTRQNPPPLPEITSNQVTSESGSSLDNKINDTDEQNTIPTMFKPLLKSISTDRITTKTSSTAPFSSSTATTPTTTSSTKPPSPKSTALTNGRTVERSTESTSTISVRDDSTTVPDMVTVGTSTVFTTIMGENVNPTFPTLSELLNGKTLEHFNEIVNKTETDINLNTASKSESLEVNKVDSTTIANTFSTLTASTIQSSTETSTQKMESTTSLSNRIYATTTTAPTTKPTVSRKFTSTPAIPTSTFLPSFLTTLFPNLFETTRAPKAPTRVPSGVIRISAAPSVTETISFAASTQSPTTVTPTTSVRPTTIRTTTTTEPTTVFTTTRRKTAPTTTTARPITVTTKAAPTTITTTFIPRTTTTKITTSSDVQTITAASSTSRSATVTDLNTPAVTTPKSIKIKELTKEQRENLKMIAQLEKEQAQLLQQLSFLTNLGLGPKRGNVNVDRQPKSASATLAERIVALAVERDKQPTTTVESTAGTTTSKPPNSIQDQLAALETTKLPNGATPLEDLLKQINLNSRNKITTPTVASVTSKSEDAILNSILKEQGILPPTPKSLAGVFDETIRPRSRPRTTPPPPQPGPLMRGLNWLMSALAPQPQPLATRKPTRKPVKPKKPPIEQELLANSPTHVTPVVTPAPSKVANALSQEDVQKLIKQLEGIQKDPSKGTLDLSQLKSIQNLINLDEGVVVMTNGEHGTTSRSSTSPTTVQPRQPTERQPRKFSTQPPVVSVSNSLEDFDLESTTAKVLRAPIGFNPVPGVDDDSPNTLVRSNLITAAVNVTRAISGFLGTALQGAAASFSSLFGGSALGTRLIGNVATGSSAG